MSEKAKVYVIAGGRVSGFGDLIGCLMTADGEVLYQHVSSTEQWLRLDLTENFGRRAELEARYPAGYDVEFIDGFSNAPQWLKDANRAFADAEESTTP